VTVMKVGLESLQYSFKLETCQMKMSICIAFS